MGGVIASLGTQALSALLWLVDSPDPSPLPETPPVDPERVTPGLLGLLSFLFLVVAVFLLYRSMRKQMRKVDPNLPPGPGDREREADEMYTEEAEEAGEKQDEGAPDPAKGPAQD